MLSEEALVLYATAGACVLLVLGVLELMVPTRARHPRRRVPSRDSQSRDPIRRARATPLPADTRGRESTTPSAPVPPVRPPLAPPVAAAPRPLPPPSPALPSREEPPIERLLLAEAESVRPEPSAWPRPSRPPAEERSAPILFEPIEELADSAPPVRAEPPRVAEPVDTPVEIPTTSELDRPAEPIRVRHAEPDAEPVMAPGPSLVDRCFALYEAGKFQAVLSEAVAALETVRIGGLFMESGETARLWGIVALARQAVGERDGARAALQEALAIAPGDERPTWQRHFAALSLETGHDLMVQAQSGTADAEERVTTLHAALGWLEGGLTAAPDDEALRDAVAAARATLWPTYEQSVGELLQRQDFQVARRVLRQALTEENCPAELQSTFREMLANTYGGEVGQLTAEAIKRMQEGKEDEALSTLDRAEEMLAVIPEGGLPPKRRNELERRLWWSYTKVGLRRVEGGLYEEALPPLLHALGYQSVGPERREETKVPLIRALEAIVTARSPLIQRMTADGDREGALLLCEKLWSFLNGALERGLSKDELALALTRTQSLFEKLGRPQP